MNPRTFSKPNCFPSAVHGSGTGLGGGASGAGDTGWAKEIHLPMGMPEKVTVQWRDELAVDMSLPRYVQPAMEIISRRQILFPATQTNVPNMLSVNYY